MADIASDLDHILQAADQLHRLGRLDQAEALYERIVRAQPSHFEALHRLGIIGLQTRRFAEAKQRLGAALAVRPEDAEARSNFGMAQLELGETRAALATLDEALTINPLMAEAHRRRGEALRALGRLEPALAAYARALVLRPGDLETRNGRGLTLIALRRPAEAVRTYDRLLALRPDQFQALANRGTALRDLGRPAEALADYDRALALNPNSAEVLSNRGVALSDLGRPEAALDSYERALTLKPDLLDAWDNKGVILAEFGRVEAATAAMKQAIALDPRRVRSYYNLTQTETMTPDDPHLAALRALATDAGQFGADDQIHLHFALAKACADVGERRRSLEHQIQGAALKRTLTPYDEAATLAGFARSKAVYGAGRMRALGGLGDPSPAPVFIVGMPRSGTTLIEQILASHPQVAALGESQEFARAAAGFADEAALLSAEGLRRLGMDYLVRIGAAATAAGRITNKTPDNFRMLGLIHLALPNARVVHARRDPLDTCVSCFSKLFGGDLAYTYDLAELGRYYRAYQSLMDHWRRVLPEGVMLEVDYEAVVDDLEGEARRIVDHCGLDWDPRCLDFHRTERWVRTASAVQVRQPLHRRAIGRWRDQRDLLIPLIDQLDQPPD